MPGTRSSWIRAVLFIAVVTFAGWVGYSHRASLLGAGHVLRQAQFWWLAPAAAAIGAVYLCRSAVYGACLQTLGYSFDRWFLWGTALVATSVHQLIPAGGASGYAFLTYAFHQGGVSVGQASLIAMIDSLSYAAVLATLVIASLVYLGAGGSVNVQHLALAFGPGMAVAALAVYLYVLQRDQHTFTRRVLRLKRSVTALLKRQWSDAPVENFLDQYYEGKTIIAKHRTSFLRMIGFQYLAVCCDSAAVYMAFLALGISPNLWVVFVGFVIAMAGVAVLGVPGGGGSFEMIMSAYFSALGLQSSSGIAAALLYRLVAFWLPVSVSVIVLLRMRRRRRAIVRSGARPGRPIGAEDRLR